jgi:hypothetical protein
MSHDATDEIGSPRDILHHVRRTMLPWPQWDVVADSVAKRLDAARPELRGPRAASPARDEALASLATRAVAPLGAVLTRDRADEIAAYLAGRPGFEGHHMNSSDGVARPFADIVGAGGRYFLRSTWVWPAA